tara:strand:- start:960 stop:1391 length:432 start_codon:yes stop_codon:yes gene_type:complete
MGLIMFLSLLLILGSPAHAGDVGQFTFLGEQQCAPFEGVLFDPPALSEILARQATANAACQARIDYEVSVESAAHEQIVRDWEIRYNALDEESALLIQQKDVEIEQLRKSLLRQSPRNNWMWAVGGVAVGIASTYTAYRIFNE